MLIIEIAVISVMLVILAVAIFQPKPPPRLERWRFSEHGR